MQIPFLGYAWPTIFPLCIVKDILKKKGGSITKGTVDWIKFGAKLSDKDIEVLLELLEGLKEHYICELKVEPSLKGHCEHSC